MSSADSPFTPLSDRELLLEVRRLAGGERQAIAALVASLAELDVRRLYLGEGCASLFSYCTQVLHLSEHAAYGRIEAARAARRFPVILESLAEGAVTLTAVSLLVPHLTPENHRDLLSAVRHKSKRDVEQLVTGLRPKPPVPSSIRRLPVPKREARHVPPPPSGTRPDADHWTLPSPVAPAARPAVVRPLAPERYKVQFTVGAETHAKLRRVQDLLRHSVPSDDLAVIFDRAITLLLADLAKAKMAATDRPVRTPRPAATGSRHIPAAVRRAVWARDDGRCAFVGPVGRCTELGFLEFHHVVPFAAGGEATVDNIQLRCRAHNAYESEQFFGSGPLFVRERAEWTRSGPSWEGWPGDDVGSPADSPDRSSGSS